MTEAFHVEPLQSLELNSREQFEPQVRALYWTKRMINRLEEINTTRTDDRIIYQEGLNHLAQWNHAWGDAAAIVNYKVQLQEDVRLLEQIQRMAEVHIDNSWANSLDRAWDSVVSNLVNKSYSNGSIIFGEIIARHIKNVAERWKAFRTVYLDYGWKGGQFEATREIASNILHEHGTEAAFKNFFSTYFISFLQQDMDEDNREKRVAAQQWPEFLVDFELPSYIPTKVINLSSDELFSNADKIIGSDAGNGWRIAELSKIICALLRININPERLYAPLVGLLNETRRNDIRSFPKHVVVAVQSLFELGLYKEANHSFEVLARDKDTISMSRCLDYIAVEYGAKLAPLIDKQIRQHPEIVEDILAEGDDPYVLYTLAQEGYITCVSPKEVVFQGNKYAINLFQFSAIITGQRDREAKSGEVRKGTVSLYKELKRRYNPAVVEESEVWNFAYILVPQLFLRPQEASQIARAFIVNLDASIEQRIFVVNALCNSGVWKESFISELDKYFDNNEDKLDAIVQILHRYPTIKPDEISIALLRDDTFLSEKAAGERKMRPKQN